MYQDIARKRGIQLDWGAQHYPNGATTVHPARRRPRAPLLAAAAIIVFVVGGVIAYATTRSPQPAERPRVVVAQAPTPAPVVVAPTASDAPPVGVIMADYSGGQYTWTDSGGGVWRAANVGTDAQPIAGVFYKETFNNGR